MQANGQSAPSKPAACDCSSKKVQDSLVARFIDKGTQKTFYNDPEWGLYCDSLIAICPNIAVAYEQKAIPYIKNGEYEKAFAQYDKMVALDPKGYTAYLAFVKCIFTKDYEGAIIDFKRAQELVPDSYEMDHTYPFYEGLCNLELGNYSQAEQNLKQDVRIQTGGDPKKSIHFNTLLYLGIVYYEMKDLPMAKNYLQQCLAKYPQHPDANYYLAMISRQEGREEMAGKYLRTAQEAIGKGYSINEDNMYYSYYPHQISRFEVEAAMGRKE